MNQVQGRTGPSLAEDNEALASDYEAISVGRQFVTGQRLVEALGIASGERVLDVGCGTGLLVEHIAGIVGPPVTCWASIRCRCASRWRAGKPATEPSPMPSSRSAMPTISLRLPRRASMSCA